ncbi:MAG TPA: N,N-dimethylformamidase beta subunit family domain-containing protein [Solirubrobacteraceae bacterium]|nr:N,N-dimethylformamidase beta subunit family domain-containing protein [Solirubrobacteraceae bacterium]
MTATARIAFALLVVATFAAFFVAQQLKTTPPAVQDVTATEVFSPNRDGRKDRMRMSFFLKRTDDVTATVVNRDGDEIRVLAERPLAAGERMRLVWDGTDARGRPVPDGVYRVRLNLRREGRAVLIPRNIDKDTTPPKVAVTSIGPARVPGPELLPRTDGDPAEVHFQAPVRPRSRKEVLVLRTDVRPARPVFDKPVQLADDATSWTWNGRANGRRVAAGTYVVIVRARDKAGNVGSSAPVPPRFEYGRPLPGRGGITVRYLRAQSPTTPIKAREQVAVAVDSVGERFTWRLRRIGSAGIRSRGSGTRSRVVRFAAPGGKSGLYLFEVRTRTRRTAAPVVVQARRPRDVLVVLPVTTWQGLNPVDDDGDGRPNMLAAGLPVKLARPYAKDGIPPQIRRHEALLLAQLDRKGRRYDLTTDVALARGEGPKLEDHRGVILAGDTRWLDADAARALRGFVRDGGRLLSVGTRSLRRSVTFTPGRRAISPTLPTVRDLFGARLRPVVRPPAPVSLVNVIDRIDLFAGTTGQFGGFGLYEQTVDVRGGTDAIAAAAATQDGDRQVIVAARVGRGLVIRTGLPEFSARLRESPELAELLDRTWTLLRTR